jgi:hypothetical protein
LTSIFAIQQLIGGFMIRVHSRLAILLFIFATLFSLPASAQDSSAAAPWQSLRLLRHPSLSQDRIAFRYADDIWTVSRQGGEADRLTSNGKVNRYGPDRCSYRTGGFTFVVSHPCDKNTSQGWGTRLGWRGKRETR